MLFNSFLFGGFFAAILALHALLPQRARNLLLLFASYGFYAAWSWRFLSLVLLSTALDYGVARAIAASDDPRVRRGWLLLSLMANLSLLAFFKYFGFFIESLDLLLARFGLDASGLHLDLVLPLGLSFYTLQTMGYTIDVYRRRIPATRDPLHFALFVCFFPQLVAGPIERAAHLMPQIERPRRIGRDALHEGIALASWGLLKKVLVADNLAKLVDPVYTAGAAASGPEVLIATFAFTFQIYADFSAYSDIARGTARMLGFELMRNFEMPFFSRDMQEFWRRWHISLSLWLRDYLYVPLGGNRAGEGRVSFNLFLTLFLSGLWHGSNGTFAAFGAFHGLLMLGDRAWRRRRVGRPRAPRLLGALLCTALVALGFSFFRAPSMEHWLALCSALGSGWHFEPDLSTALLVLVIHVAPLLAFDLAWWRSGDELFFLRWSLPARTTAYLVAIHLLILYGNPSGLAFVYFQF